MREISAMNILLMGHSSVGKSHLLAALGRLAFEPGAEAGFSVQAKDPTIINDIQKTSMAIERNEQIPSTIGLRNTSLVLRRGCVDVMDIVLTDLEGQAIRPGGNVDLSAKIKRIAKECSAFIIVVKAPCDDKEQREAAQQLMHALNFISDVLANKKGIPVVLVLNKIDLLPGAKGLRDKIEQERREIEEKHQEPMSALRALDNEMGAAIAPLITPLVHKSFPIYRLIKQFVTHLKGTEATPNRVFLCTSLGFDGAESDEFLPYGTGAAFLWPIYMALKAQQQAKGANGRPDDVADELLNDIRKLHTAGKSYFDDNVEGIWHSRYIGFPYANKTWEGA